MTRLAWSLVLAGVVLPCGMQAQAPKRLPIIAGNGMVIGSAFSRESTPPAARKNGMKKRGQRRTATAVPVPDQGDRRAGRE